MTHLLLGRRAAGGGASMAAGMSSLVHRTTELVVGPARRAGDTKRARAIREGEERREELKRSIKMVPNVDDDDGGGGGGGGSFGVDHPALGGGGGPMGELSSSSSSAVAAGAFGPTVLSPGSRRVPPPRPPPPPPLPRRPLTPGAERAVIAGVETRGAGLGGRKREMI